MGEDIGMSVKERNEAALAKRFQEKYFKKYQKLQQEEIGNCSVEVCDNNQKILCCLHEGRKWRLNSIYDPDGAAKLYVAHYEGMRDFALICVFGMSDGRALRELLEQCNGTQTIIVYEPDVEVFLTAMREFALEDIIENEKIYLLVEGINGQDLNAVFGNVVTYQNRELMMHCILPNYDILYQEKCVAHIEQMLYYSKREIFKKNTEVTYAARTADNILYNMPYILKGSSVYELKKAFLAKNLEDIPAIIVSAGPSLDKNIKELKKVEGKAFIIGVDSALKALVREGIQFQMAVSVDPRKNPDVFEDERVNQFPYVLANYSIPMIAEKNKNHLFFEGGYGFETFQRITRNVTGKDLDCLKTGGSVATEALSMTIDLGFRTVIFVGQDLAFTDGRGHVSGFEKSEEADKAHVAGRALTEVEAIDGGRVMTDLQMDSYRQWFEMRIAENQDRMTFYNATEGGAKIHGATAVSLSEVIEQFCTTEMDFDQLVADIPPAFTEEEQQKLVRELLTSVEHLEELEEKLQMGVQAYERLVELEHANMQSSPEYRQVLQDIAEVNRIEEDETYMGIIKLYAKQAEYAAASDIYVAEDLSVDEIADRGKRLLEGYAQGCQTCQEQMKQIMIPRLKEMLN